QPGPWVMTEQPGLFWGRIVSVWIGNLVWLALNRPRLGLWVGMISIAYHFLYAMSVAVCSIGVCSLSGGAFDVYLMAIFGLLGYIFRKIDAEPAPLLLAFVLGPMMEEFLRRTLLLSLGDASVFFTRPISGIMLAVSAILLVVVLLPSIRQKREEA